MRLLRSIVWLLSLFVLVSVVRADEREQFFETKIRPVVSTKCFKCHGGEKVSGSLRVDSLEAFLKGGDTGATLVVGKPTESLLLRALSHEDNDLKMPPDKPLPKSVVADFQKWIVDGAYWPKKSPAGAAGFQTERHWAFRPVMLSPTPVVKNAAWPRTEVDHFLLAKLEAAGMGPSPQADRATLIRRLKFDLLGLPPTYAETREFVEDTQPEAYERVVERYLSSPHYGERWGRHWLDVARYADTKGYVFQEERKYAFAYTYRDWVIRSLNADLPYDEFVRRQIAADSMVKSGLDQSEMAALGFLTLGRRFLNNQHDIIDDRLDVTIRGTMALTIACARCHDHKFDPIPAADYYSLHGVFASSHEPKDLPNAMVLLDNEKPHNSRILLRGQPGNLGPEAPRQFLQVVAGADRKPFTQGSGRLELAQAITSTDNPLTARVMVNRIWREHFHQPLVRTTSDFGLRCEPPTHPELLDNLAARFVASGWSLKWLHRELVQSAAYQQVSRDDPTKRAIDSENRLVWRMNRGRLNLEAMRDAILASADSLDSTFNGPSVEIATATSSRRRTIYGFIDRQNLPGFFRTFDFASPDTHNPGRFETTVPQQTLFLRNSPFVTAEVRRLASQLPQTSDPERVRSLYQAVFAREPDASELALATEFVAGPLVSTPQVASLWSYGFGRFDVGAGRLESFTTLPHFNGQMWRGGEALPDAQVGWAMWHANGGHPGNSQHAAVLRWTAPRNLTVRISGSLHHPANEGDGVRAFVVSSRDGQLATWTAKNNRVGTTKDKIAVEAGDTLDFVVDCIQNENNDSFNWAPVIEDCDNSASRWSASQQFRGPTAAPLDAWSQLAQVLLLSNEFQFVD